VVITCDALPRTGPEIDPLGKGTWRELRDDQDTVGVNRDFRRAARAGRRTLGRSYGPMTVV